MKKIFSLVLLISSALLKGMDKKLFSTTTTSTTTSSKIQKKEDPLELEYNPAALKKIREQKPSTPTMKMAISDDRTKIATFDDKGLIQIWDGKSGELLENAGVTDQKNNQIMKFNKEGTTIIISSRDGTTEYPVQKKEQLLVPREEETRGNKPLSTQTTQSSTSFQKESSTLKGLSSFDQPLSLQTTSIPKQDTPSSKTVPSEVITTAPPESKTSSTAITSSQEKSEFTPSTETLSTKKQKVILKSNDLNRTKIATLDEEGRIQVWNALDGTLLTTLRESYKNERVNYLSFSFDGTMLIIESPSLIEKVIISREPARQSRDLFSSSPSQTPVSKEKLDDKKEKILLTSKNFDLTRTVTLDEEGRIEVWNTKDGTLLKRLAGSYKNEKVRSIDFSFDGTTLIIESPGLKTRVTIS
ncbi:hypothetical protein H0X06_02855 [Candidatus Dependentiae bacterium]|nr:hypothetical protein [Candidatus Dependentiae bacterium]